MKPEVPILMIGLQIPVVPDMDVDQVMDAIRDQVKQAIDEVRRQQGDDSDAAETKAGGATYEVLEPFTEQTNADLLTALGYPP